jgi:hypothetical protein
MKRSAKPAGKKQIQIVFPVKDLESDEEYVTKGPGGAVMKYLSASVDEIMSWFGSYKVESIELTVSATVEAGSLIKLIVGAKGEGGVTVTLKPR